MMLLELSIQIFGYVPCTFGHVPSKSIHLMLRGLPFPWDIFKVCGQRVKESHGRLGMKAKERAGVPGQNSQGSGEVQGRRLQCPKGTLL